jgi:hypothetical protein
MSVTCTKKWRRRRPRAKAVRCTLGAACWVLAIASPLVATAAQPRPVQPVELAIEQNTRERWLHARQQPRFTRFTESRSWLLIDSLRGNTGGERRMYLTLGRSANGRDSALVVFGSDGRVASLHVGLSPRSRPAFSFALTRLFASGPPPEPRLWDIVPTFRPSPARRGARWTDTLAREAENGGFRQSTRGARVSTIIGDTLVNGRRLWVVRDSAHVRFEERLLEGERTLDTMVTVTRVAEGFIRGRSLYDPDLGLFRERFDSTELSGEAVLRYPGQRNFPTAARYERFRRCDLYDSAGYVARGTELNAASARASGGMVLVPTTDLERRLSRGDTLARDSVFAEWQRSDDPHRREQLFTLLTRWRGVTRLLDSIRVAGGDTAYLYGWLARRAVSLTEPTRPDEVRQMIAFMEDPGLAFSLGQSRDVLYERARSASSDAHASGRLLPLDGAESECAGFARAAGDVPRAYGALRLGNSGAATRPLDRSRRGRSACVATAAWRRCGLGPRRADAAPVTGSSRRLLAERQHAAKPAGEVAWSGHVGDCRGLGSPVGD